MDRAKRERQLQFAIRNDARRLANATLTQFAIKTISGGLHPPLIEDHQFMRFGVRLYPFLGN